MRKLLTAIFQAGANLVVFDEAHDIESLVMAATITGATYTDRILGGNTKMTVRNQATWVSVGNGVLVQGDMSRRYFPIALRPPMANPETRPASAFRHPDIEDWTYEHRAELLSAALTLVRGWEVAGRPERSQPASFGSFEKWERVVGGILEHAGCEGFLGNRLAARADSDFYHAYWVEHLEWLHQVFAARGAEGFTAAEVRDALQDAGADALLPPIPKLGDPSDRGFTRELGIGYHRFRDRWMDGYKLTASDEKAHGNARRWQVSYQDDGGGGGEGQTGSSPEQHEEGENDTDGDETLETGAPSGGTGGTGGTPQATYGEKTHTFTPEGKVCVFPREAAVLLPPVPPVPPEPVESPLDRFVAGVPEQRSSSCSACHTTKQLVPPARFWLACPTCFPGTFHRD